MRRCHVCQRRLNFFERGDVYPVVVHFDGDERCTVALKGPHRAAVAGVLDRYADPGLDKQAAYEIHSLLSTGGYDHLLRNGADAPSSAEMCHDCLPKFQVAGGAAVLG